jgi:hypothetical protein
MGWKPLPDIVLTCRRVGKGEPPCDNPPRIPAACSYAIVPSRAEYPGGPAPECVTLLVPQRCNSSHRATVDVRVVEDADRLASAELKVTRILYK